MEHASGVFITLLLAVVLACNGQQHKNGKTVNVENEIVELKKQLATSPKSSSLHGQLAAMLAAKGDWEASDRETGIAIQLDPNNPILYIEAAQGCRARGLNRKAVELLKRAVAIDPQNPLSHFSLGLMYEHQSDSARALAQFRETKRLIDALSLPSSSPDIRNRIIRGTGGETWYRDQFGKEYLLDQILAPLKKKLSKQ